MVNIINTESIPIKEVPMYLYLHDYIDSDTRAELETLVAVGQMFFLLIKLNKLGYIFQFQPSGVIIFTQNVPKIRQYKWQI